MKWHGGGDGNQQLAWTVVAVLVVIAIVIWRVAVFVGEHPELKGLLQ